MKDHSTLPRVCSGNSRGKNPGASNKDTFLAPERYFSFAFHQRSPNKIILIYTYWKTVQKFLTRWSLKGEDAAKLEPDEVS